MSEDLAHSHTGQVEYVPPTVLESPSLFQNDKSAATIPAFEVKFLLTDDRARDVERRLRDRLAPDPYADAANGGAYRTTTLYTETPGFDVFRRVGDYGKSKFRVRRYGSGALMYLERKDRNGDKVRKFRVSVPMNDLAGLARKRDQTNWAGDWFRNEIVQRNLAPLCRVSYERVAYLGVIDGGAVRVTFDRNVRGEQVSGWELQPVSSAEELLPQKVICEFKFRAAMPQLFKAIMESMELHTAACSKYRRFVQAAGIAPENGTGANGDAANV